MTRVRQAAAIAVVAVAVVAACGDGGDVTVDDATPDATVTVPETLTETEPGSGTPPATPRPTGPVTEDGADEAYDPCSADGLEEMGFIFVTSPRPGEEVGTPFTVEGCSNTFEANVQWRLVAQDGATISEGHTTATCGTGCVGTFTFGVAHPQAERRIASLVVFETSPEDGSEKLVNAIPLILAP